VTFVALALLLGASWAVGGWVLSRVRWPGVRRFESISLTLTAGLGLVALLLSMLALGGRLAYATPVLAVLSAVAAIGVVRSARPAAPARAVPALSGWNRALTFAVLAAAGLACLGAIAPVTDDDALAFLPSVRHIAETGALRVWSDQARSMFPQSQQVLLAYVMRMGGDRLGALTAIEWLMTIGVVSALLRRVCERSENTGAALVIALGSPVVAFQVPSTKEDLLLLPAAAACAFCLVGEGSLAELAAAGLFAGLAAGAKYPGLGIAVGAVAWTLISRRDDRWRASAVVAVCAAAAGGFWYLLNMWRFANPVAPFVFGATGTTFDAATANALNDGMGAGRSVFAFLVAPLRIFVEPSLFCGRGNLFNPLAYAGLAGLFVASARRRSGGLFFMAALLYVGWFFNAQNARLLLPAVVFLAPAAADRLTPFLTASRFRLACRAIAVVAVAASLGVVAAVGIVRAVRYVRDPANYLANETQRYEDIAWMNQHLDPSRHRVGSSVKVIGYLTIPALVLDPTRELEIGTADFGTPDRLLAALRRQGITHLFGSADDFESLAPHLRLIRANPASRLGGVRFFREPPTEATAVFEVLP
jgi:hypothetical protein